METFNIVIVWDMTLCNLIDGHQYFGGYTASILSLKIEGVVCSVNTVGEQVTNLNPLHPYAFLL
jgi:hypothetical protein